MLHGDVHARVLTVLSYTLYPYALYPDRELSDEVSRARAAEEEAGIATHDARLILEKAGFAVETTHRFGNPPDEIIAELEEWKPDLLVMGRRGVHGMER